MSERSSHSACRSTVGACAERKERNEDNKFTLEIQHHVKLSDYEDAPWRIERLKNVMSIYKNVCDYFDNKAEQPYARGKIAYIKELHDRKGNLFVTLKSMTEIEHEYGENAKYQIDDIAGAIKNDMQALWNLHNEVQVEVFDYRGEEIKPLKDSPLAGGPTK